MLYSEKVKLFAKQHPCEEITVDGARYRYVLCGKAGARTLVFLNGGMVAQIYVQRYPGETGGLVLISTGGMDENTLKSLKRKYRLAPLMLWYMKHCNYEKLKPKLIRLGMSHLRGEGPEEAAYAQDMFETIFRGYRQEKDDFFSEKMQRDLIRLMHEPRIAYVSGGHLTTVLQAEKFIETIRAFLPSLGSNADRREWQ